MRLAFAGTPEFAAVALRRLIEHGHEIVLVLTRQDKQAGRGMRLVISPVSEVALEHGIALFKPATPRDPLARARLSEAHCEAMVVAAYGLILPADVLVVPKRGCLNIHASLLPRWRGAAPVHRAIEAGDPESGVSIMQMDAGLDTGAVLLQRRLAISAADTAGTLTARLSSLGAEAIVEALAMLDDLEPVPQNNALATYADKVSRAEARIDWSLPAEAIERRLRAFDPFPGCETLLDGGVLKIWAADVVSGDAPPGTVITVNHDGVTIATGVGALALQTVQRQGGRRMAIAEFLRAAQLKAGTILGA
jgi:methionyl-tRNA formyltransferase